MSETKLIELKIDRTTLPEDVQSIKWQTHKDFQTGKWKYGRFKSRDDLFCVGFIDLVDFWNFSWEVFHWKAL